MAFTNELGRIALPAGVNPGGLAELMLMDRKLNRSSACLRPVGPYGGPCLGKDLQATVTFARDAGLELSVLAAAPRNNDRHVEFLLSPIRTAVVPPGPVLLVGVSVTDGTDHPRGSPSLALAEPLLLAGYELEVVDPDLAGAARRVRPLVLAKTLPGLVGRLPTGLPVGDIPRAPAAVNLITPHVHHQHKVSGR
jgi:GDP-mannose 6-dehydrogenase